MSYRFLSLALCLTAAALHAGEIRLRSECQAGSALVRLADVAEFEDLSEGDQPELAALPLFPAPQAGLTRTVTAQEVRETMSLYGLSLPKLRVSGQCRVAGHETVSEAPDSVFHSAKYSIGEEEAESRPESDGAEVLPARVVAYLQTKERIRTQWTVQPQLTAEQAEAIVEMENPAITGGQAPWIGRQVFSIKDRNLPGARSTTFKADVTRVARAIVARRQLASGEVLGGDDVELAEVNPQALTASAIVELEDAVGKEVKQSIPAGQIITATALRRPLVVKRNELIAVYSVAAGIQVKATAKALADAALGDVITLEATETKKQFQGRVTAPQEAMVFVDSPKVAGEPAPAASARVANQKSR